MIREGIIDKAHVLIAALFPLGAFPRIAEHCFQLVFIQRHRIVDEPLQAIGPPLLIIDTGTTVIAIPERLAGGRRRIEVVFQIVILQSIVQRGIQIVLLHLQDVQFDISIS